MDGRIAGVLAATLALAGLVYQALGLFTSLPGVLIAGTIAAAVGAGAGMIADRERVGRTATVVVSYVAVILVAYLLVAQSVSRNAPPGSQGGATIAPPH